MRSVVCLNALRNNSPQTAYRPSYAVCPGSDEDGNSKKSIAESNETAQCCSKTTVPQSTFSLSVHGDHSERDGDEHEDDREVSSSVLKSTDRMSASCLPIELTVLA